MSGEDELRRGFPARVAALYWAARAVIDDARTRGPAVSDQERQLYRAVREISEWFDAAEAVGWPARRPEAWTVQA